VQDCKKQQSKTVQQQRKAWSYGINVRFDAVAIDHCNTKEKVAAGEE